MTDAVMVAVRCRPFNKREAQLEAKCIVQMNGPKTTLLDPTGSTAPRDFTFDFSYWSFDPSAPHFATNPKVYSDLGVSVLNNAWGGFNCCLFAYGQTGSGKCWAPGTKLMMYDGSLRCVEDIREHDLLMGDDSTPREVIPGSVIKGHGPMFRIDHTNGERESWEVNGQHILVVTINAQPKMTQVGPNEWRVQHYSLINNLPSLDTQHFTSREEAVATLDHLSASSTLTFECSVLDYLELSADVKKSCYMFQPSRVEFPHDPITALATRVGTSDLDALAEHARRMGREINCRANAPSSSFASFYADLTDLLSSISRDSLAIRRAFLVGMIEAGLIQSEGADGLRVRVMDDVKSHFIHIARGVGCAIKPTSAECDIVTIAGSAALATLEPLLRHASSETDRADKNSSVAADADADLLSPFSVSPIPSGPYHGFMVTGNARLLMSDYIVSHNSYSMVGYGEDKGIVPQAMEEMFNRIARNKDKNVKFMVEASMMEIYNEKVRDLFNPDSDKGNINGLKVRDNPQTGPYVEDLSRCLIKSYAEFTKLLDDGNAVRTIAATQMNATSSRAHTVFQIVFTKTTHDEETNKSSAMTSKINLVDLAGSERLSKTGASGQQMKEGIGINKSLTALGNCIEKLAKKASQKKGAREVHVPYRDSVLTWLLKESLGGNAKTIMIAAISPADDNYDESLSTLRYADRAKQIKNSAVVNEDENGRIIRELKREIQALRDALARGGGSGATASGGAPESGMTDKEKEEYLALKEQMKQNEELVKKMNMSWEEKMKESEELAFKRAQALASNSGSDEKKKKLPHMVNLHKDKLMSECLTYFFPHGKTRLCTKAINPPPTEDDIILSGLQIKPDHATAEYDEKSHALYLTPGESARVFVNGKLIKERIELHHNDRLICGAHLVFRLIFPNHATDDADSIFDWEFANKELTTSTIEALNKPDEEQLRAQREQEEKMAKMQAEIELEKQRSKEEQERKQREYEQTLRDIAAKKAEEIAATKRAIEEAANAENQKALAKKLAEREAELERERAAAAKQHSERLEAMRKEQFQLEQKLEAQKKETQTLIKKHEVEKRDRQLLEENLMHIIPLVNEANAICTELGQSLRYSIKLEAKRSSDDDGFTERTDVWVRVVNLEDDMEVLWDMDTLAEALYTMRELYNNFMRSGEIVIPRNKAENPFHLVPNGPMLIGTARLYLQPCFFLLPINESTAIIDYRGEHKGQLYVNLIPIPPRDEDTKDLAEEDLFFEEEELTELKGEPLTIRLEIKKCMGLPQKYSKNVYVQYRFFYDATDQKTEACMDTTINPLLNYERKLLVDIIEDEFIEHVKSGVLEFNVYGEQPIQPDEDDNDDDGDANGKGRTKGKSSKRNSMKRGSLTSIGLNPAQTERLQKLESILREITSSVDPDQDPDTIVRSDPELIVRRVKEIVVKEKELEHENFVLKSPQKVRPVGSDAAAAADNDPGETARLSAENARIRLELESLRNRRGDTSEADELRAQLEALRSASPSTSPPIDEATLKAMRDENESLKSALESLKNKSSPTAVEVAQLTADMEEKAKLLAEGETELASLRRRLETKEREADEYRRAREQESELRTELEAKLANAASPSSTSNDASQAASQLELERLRRELESARGKIQTTPMAVDPALQSEIERRDKELEELRKQLEAEKGKKSSACTIL